MLRLAGRYRFRAHCCTEFGHWAHHCGLSQWERDCVATNYATCSPHLLCRAVVGQTKEMGDGGTHLVANLSLLHRHGECNFLRGSAIVVINAMHLIGFACWRTASTGASARRLIEAVDFELTERRELLARVPRVHDTELYSYSLSRRIREGRVEFTITSRSLL